MHDPVVKLKKALYGHPDSGTFWEKHCDKKVSEVGFEAVGPEWPSVYLHKPLRLFLVIYVDDFKLAGPQENLARGWGLLRQKIRIDAETKLGHYLGATSRLKTLS